MILDRMGRARAAALVVAIAGIAAATFVQVRAWAEVRSAARRAVAAVEARRDGEARALIDRWAGLHPGSGEPDYYRAVLHVQADRPAEALDAIKSSLARGYPEGPLATLRAVIVARSGRFDQAEPILKAAFDASAEPQAEVAEALSRIYLKTYRLPQAMQVIRSWMEAAPWDARPYVRRIEVDERDGSEAEAIVRDYREALRRDPGLDDARLGLAQKLEDSSLFDEADREYQTLLGRDPRNLKAIVGAGRVALLRGDMEASTRHFEDALAINPREKVALRELGQIELKSGRIGPACSRLKAAVDADPFDPDIRYGYARALKIAGDDARAAEEMAVTDRLRREQGHVEELRQRLDRHPDDVDLRCEIAKWLIEHGHEAEGREWAGLILKRWPGHPKASQVLADYHAARGELGLANFYRLTASSSAPSK